MTLTTIILQILLTIPLTIILNYFQNRENRKINQLIIPSIYIIIISALVPSIKENVFLIVILEIFIRNFYITNVISRSNESSAISFIMENLISIGLSLFVYNYFISNVETVIPNPEEVKGFIWFLIILYTVYLYNLTTKDKKVVEKANTAKIRTEKTIMQYAKFKNKYSNIIKTKNILINNLTYAIMIFEDYKTPKLYRNINAYIGAVTKKETKYGIMQISSYERLTDEASIEMTISNFEKALKNSKLKENEKIDKLLTNYKQEEKEHILLIYKTIVEFSKK
jgi:hypothetical protein